MDPHSRLLFYGAQHTSQSISATCKRLWISIATWNLIDARNHARLNRDYAHKVILNKKINQSVSYNLSNWLNAIHKSEAWDKINAFRAKPQRQYGRFRDQDGNITASDKKACKLDDYFETIQ